MYNPYTYSVPKSHIYGHIHPGELSLRKEMNEFLFGTGDEAPKGRMLIFRRMKRDAKGHTVPCPVCIDPVYQERTADVFCAHCHGEKFLWTEEAVIGYKAARFDTIDTSREKVYGHHPMDISFFYFEYTLNPTNADKILEPQLDAYGQIMNPIKYRMKYRIVDSEEFTADNGMIQYWRVATESDALDPDLTGTKASV